MNYPGVRTHLILTGPVSSETDPSQEGHGTRKNLLLLAPNKLVTTYLGFHHGRTSKSNAPDHFSPDPLVISLGTPVADSMPQ